MLNIQIAFPLSACRDPVILKANSVPQRGDWVSLDFDNASFVVDSVTHVLDPRYVGVIDVIVLVKV